MSIGSRADDFQPTHVENLIFCTVALWTHWPALSIIRRLFSPGQYLSRK